MNKAEIVNNEKHPVSYKPPTSNQDIIKQQAKHIASLENVLSQTIDVLAEVRVTLAEEQNKTAALQYALQGVAHFEDRFTRELDRLKAKGADSKVQSKIRNLKALLPVTK